MKSQDGMLMTQTKALHDTQRTIQSCLKELLDKERRPEEISVPPINQNYRWNMMNPDWRLEVYSSIKHDPGVRRMLWSGVLIGSVTLASILLSIYK